MDKSHFSPLHSHIYSLPELVQSLIESLSPIAKSLVSKPEINQCTHVYLIGCGDSYFAGLNAQLAFEQTAGIPCSAQTAMKFSRYTAPVIPFRKNEKPLIIGVSVSGHVTRTIEGVDLGRQAGGVTVAATGSEESPLAKAAEFIMETAVPLLPGTRQVVPGCRSYFASQIALYLIALHLGYQRNHLSFQEFENYRKSLINAAGSIESTVIACDAAALAAAKAWTNQKNYIFCGSGPNFGTASFSAAKILEASGHEAAAQDLEEWAHLQYFAKEKTTATWLISAAMWDEDRALEIAAAANQIGRQLAIIAPKDSSLAGYKYADFVFPTSGIKQECYSPLLTAIPGLLFASHIANIVSEPYFRDFKGGRSAVGGGGISKIRDSHRISSLPSPKANQEDKIFIVGGLRLDYLITRHGKQHNALPGGNALYAAAGAAVWASGVRPFARYGDNFPASWLSGLKELGVNTEALVAVPGNQDHRTFFAYTAEGIRVDTKPELHYSLIGQTMPRALEGYIDSTPLQDDDKNFEPLAIRPADWSENWEGVSAVHLAPQPLATHLHLPPILRKNGIPLISLDPGERYMVPNRISQLKNILPQIDIFLPSESEVKSLLGDGINLWQAADKFSDWGSAIVIIKIGPQGVLVYQKDRLQTHIPAYHDQDDDRIVDVTGAGDAFCGGFLVGYSKYADPILSAQMGLVSASLVLEGYGALYALSVDKGLAEQRLSEIRSR